METRNKARTRDGRPRKRPSYNLDDVKPAARPKKKQRLPPKKKFPLMKLPTEVRLKILRELLWQEEPLQVSEDEVFTFSDLGVPSFTTFSFSPAVLRTCKQLHAEGEAILYENTIEVLVADGYCTTLFGLPMLGSNDDDDMLLPLSVERRMRRLHITIENGLHPRSNVSEMKNHIRDVVKVIEQHPQWDHLSISHCDPTFCGFSLPTEVWQPFGLLRGLKEVNFQKGALPEHRAKELASLMTGDSAVVNLPAMFDELVEYVQHTTTFPWVCRSLVDKQTVEDGMRGAETAMELHDELLFFKARQTLVQNIKHEFEAAENRMYDKDPDWVREERSIDAGGEYWFDVVKQRYDSSAAVVVEN